ncbi:hypothetical protein MBANPS3_011224 [Mucor bainieri]
MLDAAEESSDRMKRLILHLLDGQRQLEQNMDDLRAQQRRLFNEFRDIQGQLPRHPTVIESVASTPPQQQQELTPEQEQQPLATPFDRLSIRSVEFEDDALPPSKKQRAASDDSQQTVEATTAPEAVRNRRAEQALTRSQKQRMDREERARKLDQIHQEARKEAHRQKDEQKDGGRSYPWKHTAKRGRRRRRERKVRFILHDL